MLKHLQPLPISEEMLGAYLEGNLTADEVGYVESFLETDDVLKGLVDEIGETSSDWMMENLDTPLYDELNGMELPEINGFWTDDNWDNGVSDIADSDTTYPETDNFPGFIDEGEVLTDDDNYYEL